MVRKHLSAISRVTRKNFPDAQKLFGWQCHDGFWASAQNCHLCMGGCTMQIKRPEVGTYFHLCTDYPTNQWGDNLFMFIRPLMTRLSSFLWVINISHPTQPSNTKTTESLKTIFFRLKTTNSRKCFGKYQGHIIWANTKLDPDIKLYGESNDNKWEPDLS